MSVGCIVNFLRTLMLVAAMPLAVTGASAESLSRPLPWVLQLIEAYPDALERAEGNDLVFKDSSRLPLDDGRGPKSFEQWLAEPDIKDMFRLPYVAGAPVAPPGRDHDPGRARPAALFDRLYGDCSKGDVARHLVDVAWLPSKGGQRLKFSRLHGAAAQLAKVSQELDALPASFDVFLKPSAGTYNCRPIAGTKRVSAHGHGIAIDIAIARTDYWQWNRPAADGSYAYRNQIPFEIVQIFERHGFIWGGKWHHYDTMHFEYRPELMKPVRP